MPETFSRGPIVEVTKGATTSHCASISAARCVTSSITNEAVDDLGLKVGIEGIGGDQIVRRHGGSGVKDSPMQSILRSFRARACSRWSSRTLVGDWRPAKAAAARLNGRSIKKPGWMADQNPKAASSGDKLGEPPASAIALKLAPLASVVFAASRLGGKPKGDAKEVLAASLTVRRRAEARHLSGHAFERGLGRRGAERGRPLPRPGTPV